MGYRGLRGPNLLLSVIVALAFWCGPAAADKRVALVVGNSAYRNVTPLDNPKNDAELMADTLRGLGFTLVGGGAQVDLDKAGFDNAIASFGAQVVGADVGLFYYAGHGVQVRNSNYLVPVTANPTREADVFVQMVDIAVVLSQMEGSGTKLNLVILDACRNNPFGGRGLRSTDSGLAQLRAPEGTLISYATQPGNVAKDGTDGNSPYTKALAQTLRRAGLDIFQTFNEVGLTVKRATGGEQQPWVSSSPIDGSFYFGGAPASPASVAPAAPSPTADEIFWTTIRDSSVAALFEEFRRSFPASPHAPEALARIEDLKRSHVAIVAPPVAPAVPAPPVQPAAVVPPKRSSLTCSDYPFLPQKVSATRTAEPLTRGEECGLEPKDLFKECDNCPEMVVVPAGSFTMGSPASEPERGDDEGPQHSVTLAKPFAVGRFAVTFDEWDACVAGGGCNGYRPRDSGWGRGRRPVINVSWDDAKDYLAWLSRTTSKTYRLLSEAEREYVTRAGTTTPFWWGSSLAPEQANYGGTRGYNKGAMGADRGRTVPVDSFAANPFGLYQVHGNVEELVEDCIKSTYSGEPSDGSAWTDGGNCKVRVKRGGSFIGKPTEIRSAARQGSPPDDRSVFSGFRVARTLTP